jgi:ribosomal protein S18 acetylase RimI-like enzyme
MSKFVISLRPATPEDEPFLRKLLLEVMARELSAHLWPEPMRTSLLDMQYRARQESLRGGFPEAIDSIILVGGAAAGRLMRTRTAEETHILDIAIAPERQRQGVGSAVLREVIAESGRVGIPVRLNVNVANPAVRLYERLGFRRIGGSEVQHYMKCEPAASSFYANTGSFFPPLCHTDLAPDPEVRREERNFRMQATGPAPNYDTGTPVNCQYAASTAAQQTTSGNWTPLAGLTINVPPATDFMTSALVFLCVPMSYASGNDYPGTNFAISANGQVVAVGGYTYDNPTPVASGRKPITLIAQIPLGSDWTAVQGMWSTVRGGTSYIDSFISISAIMAAPTNP